MRSRLETRPWPARNKPAPISPSAPSSPNATGYLPGGTVIPASGTLKMTFSFSDSPEGHIPTIRLNDNHLLHPARMNFLRSMEVSWAFATTFAVQKGLGKPIEILKTFQWNVQWRHHFRTDGAGHVFLTPRADGLADTHFSHVVSGGPTDVRARHAMTDPGIPNCNASGDEAIQNTAPKTSNKWEDWDVRVPPTR